MTSTDRLVAVRPHPRQVAWQVRELTAFLHVGMNTMTDREWGLGTEDPAWFDPDDLDADSWIDVLVDAEVRGVILTAKHHDGFCLWPTATTPHSVAAAPWRGGRGDLVREVADACARRGLAFGVYLSPWDRNHAAYGTSEYDGVYVAQLTELLTGYGPISTVWLDGANGEGPDGRAQPYDWARYYDVVRALQPDAVLSVCGPDVRWCGNEAGRVRADEWSVVPAALRSAELTASHSQQADDSSFARLVRSEDADLGSRAALDGVADLVWYPAEVDVSIRPGWFHHPAEDGSVRSASELVALWRSAVGGNAGLLLNVPPERHGRIGSPDAAVLRSFGAGVRALRGAVIDAPVVASSGVFAPLAPAPATRAPAPAPAPATRAPVLPAAPTTAGEPAAAIAPPAATTGAAGRARWTDGVEGVQPWWCAGPADPEPTLVFELPRAGAIDAVVLKEAIEEGQRIERIVVRGRLGGVWHDVATVGCVGYLRIIDLHGVVFDAVEVRIVAARAAPVLAGAAVLRLLA